MVCAHTHTLILRRCWCVSDSAIRGNHTAAASSKVCTTNTLLKPHIMYRIRWFAFHCHLIQYQHVSYNYIDLLCFSFFLIIIFGIFLATASYCKIDNQPQKRYIAVLLFGMFLG